MLFLIFACFNNFGVSDILPSLSNCRLILSDNIDVAKKSLFSSKGFKESIVLEIFSILSCGHASIDSLNPFEEKKDYFATSILSESINLQFDSEGRILLTSKLLKHAKIKNSMLFVGQGKTFQIWEPSTFEKFRVTAKRKSNIHRASLKWERQFNN